jgi:hypothetical protein
LSIFQFHGQLLSTWIRIDDNKVPKFELKYFTLKTLFPDDNYSYYVTDPEILYAIIIIAKVIFLAGLLVFLRNRRKTRIAKLQSTS